MDYLAVNPASSVATPDSRSVEQLSAAREINVLETVSLYLYALFALQLTVFLWLPPISGREKLQEKKNQCKWHKGTREYQVNTERH